MPRSNSSANSGKTKQAVLSKFFAVKQKKTKEKNDDEVNFAML